MNISPDHAEQHTCPECGVNVGQGESFCSKCGRLLNAPKKKPAPPPSLVPDAPQAKQEADNRVNRGFSQEGPSRLEKSIEMTVKLGERQPPPSCPEAKPFLREVVGEIDAQEQDEASRSHASESTDKEAATTLNESHKYIYVAIAFVLVFTASLGLLFYKDTVETENAEHERSTFDTSKYSIAELDALIGGATLAEVEAGRDRVLRGNKGLFIDELNRLAPDWRTIRKDPGFMYFLSLTDRNSGLSLDELAIQAKNEGNAAQFAWFFNEYKRRKAK